MWQRIGGREREKVQESKGEEDGGGIKERGDTGHRHMCEWQMLGNTF